MSKLEKLEDVLLEELKDLHSAEKQLLKALPKMQKAASSPELQAAFADHLVETEKHIERLSEIEALIGSKLSGKTCKAMGGLVEEGQDAIKEKCKNESLHDALLIGAARRVEHYEVAAYCTARAIAKQLGLSEIEQLLGQTFDEESAADEKLSTILKSEVLPDCYKTVESKSKSRTTSKKSVSLLQSFLTVGFVAWTCMAATITNAELEDGKDQKNSASIYEADNTGKNVRDQNVHSLTADKQDLSEDSAEILSTIRREVLNIENLSVNGQNVKIMLVNHTVTLKGPVATENEKEQIENTVQRVAASYQVDNQLEVTSN